VSGKQFRQNFAHNFRFVAGLREPCRDLVTLTRFFPDVTGKD
jgi:hypothetical protein